MAFHGTASHAEEVGDIKELLVAMKDVKLEELVPLAEEWCQEQGAELLEEAGGSREGKGGRWCLVDGGCLVACCFEM